MSTPADSARAWMVMDEAPPPYGSDFGLLAKELESYRGRWGLFVLSYEHNDDRRDIAARIDATLGKVARVTADESPHPDWSSLEQDIEAAAHGVDAVQVFGLEHWLDPLAALRTEPRLRAWNLRREGFAAAVSVPVLCWLRPSQVQMLARTAPDLWSWRAGVHRFDCPIAAPVSVFEREAKLQQGIDNRTYDERLSRIAELRTALNDQQASRSDALLGAMLDELATLHRSIGELDEALHIFRKEALPTYERLGDAHACAVTKGQIAGILHLQGHWSQALSMLRGDVLPVFERLGASRDRAVTMGDIAELLHDQGQIDAALDVYRNDVLPSYERLGDEQDRAVALSRLANILEDRGQYDEALRIRRKDQLPIYERLGDTRSRAVTMGQIADVHQRRGDLDEALRIRREEELPVYERLGDAREHAIAMAKVGDILQARGQVDEALRIFRDDVLPAFERLGDMGSRAIVLGRVAALAHKLP